MESRPSASRGIVALLVDHVLPAGGYRQWVLSLAGRMAVRLGYDQALLARHKRRTEDGTWTRITELLQ